MLVESIELESLVHHGGAVAHDRPLEEVHAVFGEKRVDFLALVRDGRVTGVCARGSLGFLLGSRYGFALNARSPAHMAQVERPLIFRRTAPLRLILEQSLGRHGDEFYEDVVLVDEELRLIGLIPVEVLAQLQTRLVAAQLRELQRQHETLQRRNVELFQTGHALRQAEALSAGLFASNALGVALLDSRGKVQAGNRRLEELLRLGDRREDRPNLALLVAADERARFYEMLEACELGRLTPGAREFHLELAGPGPRLFRISTGWIRETSQVCACLDDITEQRAMERHLQRQEKQQTLDTLAGGIAHELNNKLTPVLGFAQLLAEGAGAREGAFAECIVKSSLEAAQIIRQLLQLSKPAAGQPEEFELGALVREALLVLKFQLREARVEARLEAAPEPVRVRADPAQIKQVIINLVLNAIHATERAAAPEVVLMLARQCAEAVLTVRDNGTGIAPEIRERIFDPFFTTKSPDRGTGLGLSISSGIARQHGGDLSCASPPGAGAVFTLRLPALAAAAPAPREGADQPRARESAPGIAGRRRVLVVEDEEVVRRFLQEALRASFPCEVDCAAGGREGLRLVSQADYDLVVSDIRMPEMTGPEFYLKLREVRPEMAKQFVFVTGFAGGQKLEEEIARWQVPVVAKPFTIRRLADVCAPFLTGAAGGG
ncbi:MAG: response regulator [Opitutae bacterium]|nr:response regulator [Opitutae bacterium]